LISREVAANDLRLLLAINHEATEAIMQITAKEDRYKYQGIKELILKSFPPDERNSLPVDLYVNHVVARALSWLLLIQEGIDIVGAVPADEERFLRAIKPVITAHRHNYFTAEFWDAAMRRDTIAKALNKGMVFYQVASPADDAGSGYTSIVRLDPSEQVQVLADVRLAAAEQFDAPLPNLPVYFGEEDEHTDYRYALEKKENTIVESINKLSFDNPGENYGKIRGLLDALYEIRATFCKAACDNRFFDEIGMMAQRLESPDAFMDALLIEKTFYKLFLEKRVIYNVRVYCPDYGTSFCNVDVDAPFITKTVFECYENLFQDNAQLRAFVGGFADRIKTDPVFAETIRGPAELERYIRDLALVAPSPLLPRSDQTHAPDRSILDAALVESQFSNLLSVEKIRACIGECVRGDLDSGKFIRYLATELRRKSAVYQLVSRVKDEPSLRSCLSEIERHRRVHVAACRLDQRLSGVRIDGQLISANNKRPPVRIKKIDFSVAAFICDFVRSKGVDADYLHSRFKPKFRILEESYDFIFEEKRLLWLDRLNSIEDNDVLVDCILHIEDLILNHSEDADWRRCLTPPADNRGLNVRAVAAGEHGAQGSATVVKCIVLDCDGVLWGGIIGEDGIEHIDLSEPYLEFQNALKRLKEQGVILAINSKNNPEDVGHVLDSHPMMILRKQDFAVIKANWQDKAANLKEIARELNIGMDCMLFLDDSPRERSLAALACPEIKTPALPDDAASRVKMLDEYTYSATGTITGTDRVRTELYAMRAKREELRRTAASLEDFYRALDMKAVIRKGIDSDQEIARVAQLTQRTNQFNLTLKRYTEDEIRAMAKNPAYQIFTIELSDKFGDAGVVGAMILSWREVWNSPYAWWDIDTFCLSCRAVGMGVERAFMHAVLTAVTEDAKTHNQGEGSVYGSYIRGEKNFFFKNIYAELGFWEEKADVWRFGFDPKLTRIIKKPAYIQTVFYDQAGGSIVDEATEPLSWNMEEFVVNSLHANSRKYVCLFTGDWIHGEDFSDVESFLPRLRDICGTDERFRKALCIEIALAGLTIRPTIGAEGTFWCPDYEREYPSRGFKFEYRSVTRELLEIIGDREKFIEFVDKWGNYFKKNSGLIVDGLSKPMFLRADPSAATSSLKSFWADIGRSDGASLMRLCGDYGIIKELVGDIAVCDTKCCTILWFDLLDKFFSAGVTYRIQYDDARLSVSQIAVIKEYANLLSRKLQSTFEVIPFSSAHGSQKGLLHIWRVDSMGKLLGEGAVDVLDGVTLQDRLLRITGLMNIALTLSHINKATASDKKRLIQFIKGQYELIVDGSISVDNDIGQLRKLLMEIPLDAIDKASPEAIDAYNQRARALLIAA
ncbi:MAG: HAD-IIIC family phosphatase, partial [Candidatus Omnitrophica bacterium]|nr:HAD-IIIC family phosphatase [Candidatus Omnitrophota bacterium]